MKTVQISMDLFMQLARYFYLDDQTQEAEQTIKKAIEDKIDSLARHECYTGYKMADSPEKREEYRRKYLDMAGINPDFRW